MGTPRFCEAYAATAMADLRWSAERVRAVDKITAAALCSIDNPNGLKLWQARDGLESSSYKSLATSLLKAYRHRYGDDLVVAQAIVEQALHEFDSPHCRRCQGTREIVHAELRVSCPDCMRDGGEPSGMHRYTDSERARTMQLSYARVKHSAHKIRWVLELLGSADKRMGELMSERMR